MAEYINKKWSVIGDYSEVLVDLDDEIREEGLDVKK